MAVSVPARRGGHPRSRHRQADGHEDRRRGRHHDLPLATVSELVNGTILLGAIPVDMRDRIVHPLIAILGAAALFLPMAVESAWMRARKLPGRP